MFTAETRGKPSEVWIAPLDRSAPPKRIAASGEASPHFGPDGTVWFRYSNGKANLIGLMNKGGSARRQVTARPISTVMSSSPDGHWLVAMAPASDADAVDTIAIPADGGVPRVIGRGRYPVAWARDGRFVYVGLGSDQRQTVAIPVSRIGLAGCPSAVFVRASRQPAIPGAQLIDGFDISPGPNPSTFAYVKTTTQRNLFRISLH